MRGFSTAGFGGLRLAEICAAGLSGGAGGPQQGWRFRDKAPSLDKWFMNRFVRSCVGQRGLQVWGGELNGEGLESQIWG